MAPPEFGGFFMKAWDSQRRKYFKPGCHGCKSKPASPLILSYNSSEDIRVLANPDTHLPMAFKAGCLYQGRWTRLEIQFKLLSKLTSRRFEKVIRTIYLRNKDTWGLSITDRLRRLYFSGNSFKRSHFFKSSIKSSELKSCHGFFPRLLSNRFPRRDVWTRLANLKMRWPILINHATEMKKRGTYDEISQPAI